MTSYFQDMHMPSVSVNCGHVVASQPQAIVVAGQLLCVHSLLWTAFH